MWTEGAHLDREVAADGRTGAMVNGQFMEFEPGTSLVETALQLANNAGYGKFRVILNGEEIEPEDAPETFSDGDVMKIMAYDVAG